jgi:DNA replication and repair protein RecF
LEELLPLARVHQSKISGEREILDAEYVFSTNKNKLLSEIDENESDTEELSIPLAELKNASKEDIAMLLLKLLKEYRSQEIWRRQTLIGPHRDDISFTLNHISATAFASQGQQRSLVLAMKLAELDRITHELEETPVLLLDDVLAELDVLRQGFLMAAVSSCMQTIITTTHLA